MKGVQWLNTSETLATRSLRIPQTRGAMACAAKERTALEKHAQQMKHMEDAAVMLYPPVSHVHCAPGSIAVDDSDLTRTSWKIRRMLMLRTTKL